MKRRRIKSYWQKWLKWHLRTKRDPSPSQLAEWRFLQVARKLRRNDVAIDCGANIGQYTSLMALRGATVHAFEPDPWTFQELSKTVRRFRSVVLHNKAVGVKNDRVPFYRKSDFDSNPFANSTSSSTFMNKRNVDKENFVMVDQIDFVDFIENLNREVAILKIDIEGAEFDVLERLLNSKCIGDIGVIFVDTHDGKIPEIVEKGREVRAMIKSRGLENISLDWR